VGLPGKPVAKVSRKGAKEARKDRKEKELNRSVRRGHGEKPNRKDRDISLRVCVVKLSSHRPGASVHWCGLGQNRRVPAQASACVYPDRKRPLRVVRLTRFANAKLTYKAARVFQSTALSIRAGS
jgi:hypothetical protein